jgi:hypothetical protein
MDITQTATFFAALIGSSAQSTDRCNAPDVYAKLAEPVGLTQWRVIVGSLWVDADRAPSGTAVDGAPLPLSVERATDVLVAVNAPILLIAV